MKAIRKYGTCFFEQYAQIALSALVSREFDTLVNKDRPDLQSKDGHSIGIEVTRAMEESRTAEKEMLKDLAGLSPSGRDETLDQILEYGYSFGIGKSKYIGARELLFLADVNDLYMCNLDDGLSAATRLIRYRITPQQRKEFYLEAVHRQINK